MEYILLVISIVILCFCFYKLRNIKKINTEIENKNKEIEEQNKRLKNENKDLLIAKEKEIKKLTEITDSVEEEKQKRIKIAQKEYEDCINRIKKDYEDEKIDWEESKKLLQESYASLQDKTLQNLKLEEEELNKVRSTRAAAQEALLKEKEIKENKDFYCLPISVADKNDIQVLERIKKDLNKPRILSMLIWSTYFQKQMTALCNNVLGTKTVCGIYKITNQITNECYIGQSVDIAKRWKDHAKCGLGIDTPAGNKLYKAMQEQGIWNFSWELLEQCPREDLDKKEKTYIELYMSNDFGYNSQSGNRSK